MSVDEVNRAELQETMETLRIVRAAWYRGNINDDVFYDESYNLKARRNELQDALGIHRGTLYSSTT